MEQPSGARVRDAYLVERYQPGSTIDDVVSIADRVADAADQMSQRGIAIAYLGTMFLPDDEAILDTFTALSVDDVRAANKLAHARVARVTKAAVIAHDWAAVPESHNRRSGLTDRRE